MSNPITLKKLIDLFTNNFEDRNEIISVRVKNKETQCAIYDGRASEFPKCLLEWYKDCPVENIATPSKDAQTYMDELDRSDKAICITLNVENIDSDVDATTTFYDVFYHFSFENYLRVLDTDYEEKTNSTHRQIYFWKMKEFPKVDFDNIEGAHVTMIAPYFDDSSDKTTPKWYTVIINLDLCVEIPVEEEEE